MTRYTEHQATCKLKCFKMYKMEITSHELSLILWRYGDGDMVHILYLYIFTNEYQEISLPKTSAVH